MMPDEVRYSQIRDDVDQNRIAINKMEGREKEIQAVLRAHGEAMNALSMSLRGDQALGIPGVVTQLREIYRRQSQMVWIIVLLGFLWLMGSMTIGYLIFVNAGGLQ